MRKMNKRILSLMLCLVCALALLPTRSAAVSAIDTGRETALTVSYTDAGAPVSGVPFEIYYVAAAGADGTFTLSGDFKDYPVRINGLSAEGQRALAGTLAAYVDRDGLSPYDSGVTNSQGLLYFPNQRRSMSTGMYLVVGRTHASDGRVYTTEPIVVTLPTQVDGKWEYKVIVEPKHSAEDQKPSDETVSRTVQKRWSDTGYENKRPASVTASLLKNGEEYDTVRLDAEGGWQYTWEELPHYDAEGKEISWTLREVSVKGYTSSVTQTGDIFVLTNTYDKTKLPQTGQLWWPVPLLAAAGLGLICVGLSMRKREENE